MDAHTTLLIHVAVKAGEMRERQKAFFKNRTQDNLFLAREAESELDELLAEVMQPSLRIDPAPRGKSGDA